MNEWMPICLNLRGQNCLVIGGGQVAWRKIKVLREFGAIITCLSPSLVPELVFLKKKNKIGHIKGAYSARVSFKKYKLIIAATDKPLINERIARQAQKERVMANIVDGSVKGDVIMPAILKTKGVLLGVSTNGRNPCLAKRIRDILKYVV